MPTNKRNFLFRLDAGNIFGMGHLSRCITLANTFGQDDHIAFWIKTDAPQKVEFFLKGRLLTKNMNIEFLNPEISKENDLEVLIKYCTANKAFLILDHYSFDDIYQKGIVNAKIKFLLFDSHGKSNFYSDAIIHASPSATNEVYIPLQKNPNALLLLGTSYAIMDPGFSEVRKGLQIRKSLNNMMLCMGGGGDKGASLKILQFLETSPLNNLNIEVIAGINHPDFKAIQALCAKVTQFIHIPGTQEMPKHMVRADLGIIAPGTLSYEAACMGMPMLFTVIADNQNMNAHGWEKLGCAINMGTIEELKKEKLISYLKILIDNPNKIQKMSELGMKAVDGKGVIRVKEKIDQLTK